MKTLLFYQKLFTLLLLTLCYFTVTFVNAQTIQIDSTFTTDGEIFPFGPNDTIYGLSISGSVNLYSDTSLVRVILTDEAGNEWMVYEAYPMILPCKHINLIPSMADETKYLEVYSPQSLTIQIIEASFTLDTIYLESNYQENLETYQQTFKKGVEREKVDSINYFISGHQMLWLADTTPISNLNYIRKSALFGGKYNLKALDYYVGGIYDPIPGVDGPVDSSTLIDSWDWRSRHGANDPEKDGLYYDGDILGTGWLTCVKDQNIIPSCNGLCYIYGPLAAIEGVANLYYNSNIDYDLSEQNVLDCDGNYEDECERGSYGTTNNFVRDTGVVNESYYPRDSIHGDCRINNPPGSGQLNYHIYIKGSHNVSYPTATPDQVKDSLINRGPLVTSLANFSGNVGHSIALVGYKIIQPNDYFLKKNNQNGFDTIYVQAGSQYIGHLAWLYKNSWGINWGFNGFAYLLNQDFSPTTVSYYKLPVSDTLSNTDTIVPRDADHDGYWNWGISKSYPLNDPCSWLKDSDDSENRLGPFDSNYYSIPIMPEMIVTHGLIFNADTIHNGDFYDITINTVHDTTVKFFISNPGTAQLNLVQYNMTNFGIVTIEYQDPSAYFDTVYLPRKSICMDGDTTSFKISVLAGATPGSLAHLHIHLSEPDLYPDSTFEFTLLLNGCETTSGYDSINTSVTWSDSCRSQSRDLHIQDGGELTITGTVLFSPQADVIVEKGGELIIDGGRLSKSCEDELWNGIQVWGDSSSSQYPYSNQGFLNIKNNGCIEYAKTGIFTGKFDNEEAFYNFSGGIIVAEDAIFRNNKVDAEFLPFVNDHPILGNEIDNFSGFRYCTFKTYDPEMVLHQPDAHVILDGVKGVDFSSCTFVNQEVPGHPFADDEKGTGILVYDADMAVTAFCSEAVTPCDEYDSSYFKNLRYGIRAFNTGGNKYFRVSEAVFDSNVVGIYLSGFHQPTIVSSYFYSCLENEQMQGLHDPFYGGLYLDGSTGYQVENNHFSGPYSEVPDSGYIAKIGIYVKNSGEDDNEIYNNLFTGIDAGIIAEGVNKGERSGLCLKCNDFLHCANDIIVITDPFFLVERNMGIKTDQGSDTTLSTALAGNTFTSEIQEYEGYAGQGNQKYWWSYYNEAEYINYYHHGDTPPYILFPTSGNFTSQTISLYDKLTIYSKSQACPSSFNNNHLKSMEDSRTEISNANLQLDTLLSDYYDLLDGGSTESMNFEIVTSMPEEALELRQELLSRSPYLSDTVMKNAILKENVLPNAMIRDVMIANPQSAKSFDLLETVESRFDPMPDYMLAEILQGREQLGAKEMLVSNISYWEQYRARAVRQLIREYLTDSTIVNRSDSLIQLFENEPDLESKYRLAFTYWEANQEEQALAALNNVPSSFTLSSRQAQAYDAYIDFFTILESMKDSSLHASQLDSVTILELITMMDENLPGVSACARGLLVKGRHIDYTENVSFPAEVKSYPSYNQDSKKPKFSEKEELYLFPNPAGDFVVAYFNTIELGKKGRIVINDIQGKELCNLPLQSEQNQQVIDLSTYPNGIYLFSLFINEKLIESVKLSKGLK